MHKFFTFSEIFTTFVPVDTNKETLLNFVENFWYFCKLSRQRIDILIKSFISKSKLSTYLFTFPSNNRSSFLRSIDFSHLRNGRTPSLWTVDGCRGEGCNNNFINTEIVRLWDCEEWSHGRKYFSPSPPSQLQRRAWARNHNTRGAPGELHSTQVALEHLRNWGFKCVCLGLIQLAQCWRPPRP